MKKFLSLVALGACLSFGAAQAQDKAPAAKAPAPVTAPAATPATPATPAAPAAATPAAPATAAAPAASCESKAIDKNGKPLAGAAKNSFMKKCEKDAKA